MNIRDFEYLLAVVKYKHFGKAAEKCFISQSGLSMQLKKFEERFNVKLFERTNKCITTTPIGEEIANKAKKIIELTNEIKTTIESNKDPFSGNVKIGAFPTLAPYFLLSFYCQVIKKFPKIKLSFLEEKTKSLVKKLHSGEIEAAFLITPFKNDKKLLKSEILFKDPFYLAISPQHELSNNRSISLHKLKYERWLLLEEGHCLRDQTLDICKMIGAEEQQDFRATSLETLRQMVAMNLGITLIPEIAKKPNDNIVYLPIAPQQPSRTIGLVWRETSARHLFLKEISQLLRSSKI